MYVDAAYCYRLSSVVCRSVTVVSLKKRLKGSTSCRLGCGLGRAQGNIIRCGCIHWRHLLNITETSMCGGDAALVKLF